MEYSPGVTECLGFSTNTKVVLRGIARGALSIINGGGYHGRLRNDGCQKKFQESLLRLHYWELKGSFFQSYLIRALCFIMDLSSVTGRARELQRPCLGFAEAHCGCPAFRIPPFESSVKDMVLLLRMTLVMNIELVVSAPTSSALQFQVHCRSSECVEESRQVNATLQREKVYKKQVAEEKMKHLEAMREIEMAKNLLAKEAYEKRIAELKALKESMEKKKQIDTLFFIRQQVQKG
ncbi:hypothetical protein Vadar_010423 [Vaccinium darrowii]|uniref:Uncharacterized protein n=1 Tax=Vaccinium darrowii TaxID=229202 RepID=A0ACB7X9U5_9ERIC|nr:hypothetical protein Vadar_010423 [Vaccinium darrowii]